MASCIRQCFLPRCIPCSAVKSIDVYMTPSVGQIKCPRLLMSLSDIAATFGETGRGKLHRKRVTKGHKRPEILAIYRISDKAQAERHRRCGMWRLHDYWKRSVRSIKDAGLPAMTAVLRLQTETVKIKKEFEKEDGLKREIITRDW